MEKNEYDNNTRYCRFLGHYVPFSYCRQCNNTLFCKRIAECWSGKIDVASFLLNHFTAEEREEAMKPSLPKAVSLYEMIQKARGNNSSGSF